MTICRNSIEVSGHAKKALVCHGISAICQMVANYVAEHEWGEVRVGDGYLEIWGVQDRYIGSPLFSAMIQALRDIESEYPGNLKIEYK